MGPWPPNAFRWPSAAMRTRCAPRRVARHIRGAARVRALRPATVSPSRLAVHESSRPRAGDASEQLPLGPALPPVHRDQPQPALTLVRRGGRMAGPVVVEVAVDLAH